MSQETEVLLRTILYQIKSAKSLKQAVKAIEVMCSDDTISIVNQRLSEASEDDN